MPALPRGPGPLVPCKKAPGDQPRASRNESRGFWKASVVSPRLITTSPLCSSHQCGRTGRGQPLGHLLCASKPATFPVVEGQWILQMGKQAGRCEPTQTWPGSGVEQFCGCGRPRVASPDITGCSAASQPGLTNSSLSRSGCTKSPHSCVSYPFQGRRSGPEQEPPVPYRPAMMGVSTAW